MGLSPAAVQDLLQHIAAAEIRQAEKEKAPQVQVYGAFSAPPGKLAAGHQDAEQRECQQG